MRRDLIVVGASAGGLEPLLTMVRGLPESLSASLLIVMHLPPSGTSLLPQIIGRATSLKTRQGADGEPLRNGEIRIAPPDWHLSVVAGRIRLSKGPHENRFRPAIDALFRSAARVYRQRVIGVILSGSLDDGVAGLGLIKQLGGVAVVQDPADCLVSSMAEAALARVVVDHVVPAAGLAKLLVELTANGDAPVGSSVEATMTRPDDPVQRDISTEEQGGSPRNSRLFTCPECSGVLWETTNEGSLVYRCHVGHRYSPDSLLNGQSEALESALWTAVRALEERAMVSRRLAARLKLAESSVAFFHARAEQAERDADIIRKLLADGAASTEPPPDPLG